jgi:2-polyprenyl-3-methyl-5-hydroxy-6-metoxy-1,4-benzoquinol methylase
MNNPSELLEYLHVCPVCGASRLVPYCRVPSLFNEGEFIRYDRCGGCDVVFRNPRLLPTARIEGYRDRMLPESRKVLAPRTQAHYRYLARRLLELLPARMGRRVFDFGCGAGGFLVEAERAGLEPYGLELNEGLARHVTETYAIPVHCGQITDPDFPASRFDLIVSFEVFEHLIDPRGVLVSLASHLAPRGLLLIEVPNLHDARERWRRGATMDDSHLFYFNRHSFTRLLQACGLRVVEVHEGLRPSRLLGEAAARLPTPAYRAIERVMAAVQLKTVLGVIATPTPGSAG